jgi:hypothetical protein
MPLTDQQVLGVVQRRLIEGDDGGQSWPSALWSFGEVTLSLDQQQDRFLRATHCHVGIALVSAVIGQSRYDLPDDWIQTVLVVWRPAGGAPIELPLGDSFQADLAIPTWSTVPGTPRLFADAELPTRTGQVMPAPDVDGVFELVYIPRGTTLTGQGEFVTLVDDLARAALVPAVLGDLLSKVGRGADPIRAQACKDRVALAEAAVAILLQGFA